MCADFARTAASVTLFACYWAALQHPGRREHLVPMAAAKPPCARLIEGDLFDNHPMHDAADVNHLILRAYVVPLNAAFIMARRFRLPWRDARALAVLDRISLRQTSTTEGARTQVAPGHGMLVTADAGSLPVAAAMGIDMRELAHGEPTVDMAALIYHRRHGLPDARVFRNPGILETD
jgi:hypothetical protein